MCRRSCVTDWWNSASGRTSRLRSVGPSVAKAIGGSWTGSYSRTVRQHLRPMHCCSQRSILVKHLPPDLKNTSARKLGMADLDGRRLGSHHLGSLKPAATAPLPKTKRYWLSCGVPDAFFSLRNDTEFAAPALYRAEA